MKQQLLTKEDYLSISASTEEHFELHQGTLVGMGRTTGRHSEIVLNTASSIKQQLKGFTCKTYAESVALEIPSRKSFFLPDVMVTCDERDHADHQLKRFPSIVVEVLSPESAQRDLVHKLEAYLALPSIQYYLIISQDHMYVQVYARQQEGNAWKVSIYQQDDQIIELTSPKISLSLADIFEGVELTPMEIKGDGES